MRVIILAAGQGFLLDGMVKCLIRAPHNQRPILENILDAFTGHSITVVVGYRAVDIMQSYPKLNYIYNAHWSNTNSSYSLGLALDDEPTYVVSSDLVFDTDLIRELDHSAPNLILTEARENRILTSVHCATDSENRVRELYVGPMRNISDPEAIGVFKMSHPGLLKQWKKNCLKHGNLFVGQNLPLEESFQPILAHSVGHHRFYEINDPHDYLQALRAHRD